MITRSQHHTCTTVQASLCTHFKNEPDLTGKAISQWLSAKWFMVVSLILAWQPSSAQSFEKLNALNGYTVKVYFSAGAEAKAKRMAEQIDHVTAFYQKHIQFVPAVKLLILSPGDWSAYTKFPFYGMPHYNDKTLIVASEDNAFWRSMVPPLEKLPAKQARLIQDTYTDQNGGLTMEPFFDLLAIHELGHAYHIQDSLVMQRKWMGELFSNILLHTYIAENEPQLLPALTAFPKMVVATTDHSALKHTTLEALESNYDELGKKYPVNYGWYHCRWHIAAGKIYDKAGLVAFTNLWFALKAQRNTLDDESFASLLSKHVHQCVADVQLNWDKPE